MDLVFSQARNRGKKGKKEKEREREREREREDNVHLLSLLSNRCQKN